MSGVVIRRRIPGPKGDPGKNGKDGSNGSNGSDGSDGKDGLSAYELAKRLGFKGTLKAWIESLKGEPGKNGRSSSGPVPIENLMPAGVISKRTITATGNQLASDDIVFVNHASGTIDFNLLDATLYQKVLNISVINSGSVNIIPPLGQLINGDVQLTLDGGNYYSVDLVTQGANWYVK